MTQRYTFLGWILPFFLLVLPLSLKANGDPNNGDPTTIEPLKLTPATLDSLSAVWGHCNPITIATPNCATQTIDIAAFVQLLFTGQTIP
ncbi:MAG: hypothetical protein JNN28_06950, partial [Saprospiraceae bacterium]|nr:hypothetical protein [Saprospiraceae bacterium]